MWGEKIKKCRNHRICIYLLYSLSALFIWFGSRDRTVFEVNVGFISEKMS